MSNKNSFETVSIDPRSQRLVNLFLQENKELEPILLDSDDEHEVYANLRKWILDQIDEDSITLKYYSGDITGREAFSKLRWSEFAAIRILDYIDHEGMEYVDPNLRGERYYNHLVRTLWLAAKYGKGGGKPAFFEEIGRAHV